MSSKHIILIGILGLYGFISGLRKILRRDTPSEYYKGINFFIGGIGFFILLMINWLGSVIHYDIFMIAMIFISFFLLVMGSYGVSYREQIKDDYLFRFSKFQIIGGLMVGIFVISWCITWGWPK